MLYACVVSPAISGCGSGSRAGREDEAAGQLEWRERQDPLR